MNRSIAYRVTGGVWVLIAVVLAVAPTYAQAGPPGLTNTMCPVTTDEPVDPTLYVDHEGQRVYFCCDRCLNRFKANPAKYAAGLAQVMPVSAPVTGEANKAGRADGPDQGSAEAPGHGESAPSGEDSSVSETSQPHGHTTGAAPRPGAGEAALSDDDDHDHAAHEAGAESPFITRLIGWFGKFHPPTTHFPIGLLTAAALAEVLFIRTRRPLFDHAARFCVWLGAGGALAAVVLGWFFAGFRLVDDNWIMTTHRWLGTSVALLSLVVAWLSFVSHREGNAKHRPTYLAVLFLTVSLVGATGFLGGALVYGINHYAW